MKLSLNEECVVRWCANRTSIIWTWIKNLNQKTNFKNQHHHPIQIKLATIKCVSFTKFNFIFVFQFSICQSDLKYVILQLNCKPWSNAWTNSFVHKYFIYHYFLVRKTKRISYLWKLHLEIMKNYYYYWFEEKKIKIFSSDTDLVNRIETTTANDFWIKMAGNSGNLSNY